MPESVIRELLANGLAANPEARERYLQDPAYRQSVETPILLLEAVEEAMIADGMDRVVRERIIREAIHWICDQMNALGRSLAPYLDFIEEVRHV